MKSRTPTRRSATLSLCLAAVVSLSIPLPAASQENIEDEETELPPPFLDGPRPRVKERPNTGPMEIEAKAVKSGPAMTVISETFTGHAALTGDGKHVIYIDGRGLFAHPTGKGKERKLASEASFFRLSPDGRWVVLPTTPLKRIDLRKPGKPLPLAEAVNPSTRGGPLVSNRHVAFLEKGGKLMVAELASGDSYQVDLYEPTDQRCHFGVGVPRVFSPNGDYLTVQHGCDYEYLVETKQGAMRKLPFISARFSDKLVFGSPKSDGGMLPQVVVEELQGGKTWTLEDVPYTPFREVVPGRDAFIQVHGGKLQVVDLRKRTVETVSKGAGNVTGFISLTPDGRHALYSHYGTGWCSVHRLDLRTGTPTMLAKVTNATQCFIRPLGNGAAAGYFWRSGPRDAIAVTIDLKSGVVRKLGGVMQHIGSLHAEEGAMLITAKPLLHFVRPK